MCPSACMNLHTHALRCRPRPSLVPVRLQIKQKPVKTSLAPRLLYIACFKHHGQLNRCLLGFIQYFVWKLDRLASAITLRRRVLGLRVRVNVRPSHSIGTGVAELILSAGFIVVHGRFFFPHLTKKVMSIILRRLAKRWIPSLYIINLVTCRARTWFLTAPRGTDYKGLSLVWSQPSIKT